MQLRRPPMHLLLAAAGLAALLPITAQAVDIGNQSTAHVRLAPGLHIFDTPQVFGTDSVLELVLSGGLGCASPCHTQLQFRHTVHFDGTLKITMDDAFLTWGGHRMFLFSYWGIPDTPGTALPTGRFHTLELPPIDASLGWSTDSIYSSGTILLAQLVPEPSSLALWLGGGALLAGLAYRRRPADVRTA
jgi:hypothetical protein